MDAQDRSRSPSRRTSRVEQVVGRWLRRSRDLGSRSQSQSRERTEEERKTAESSPDQRNHYFRFNIQIQRDPDLNSHGLTLTSQSPILVQDVTAGGPADGRLVPGDQLVKINDVAADDLTPEQAAEIIRECRDTLTMTVLRTMLGPKSSFITPEKRAKLKSNPVKVHFAEEVEVNGHSQGNSLLFLPNVLKVYLENGQTKAFKFDPNTTVKDIVMTLKEKLSLSRIEHFSLVLEQRHSITKLLLLHEDERIQEVVQKKEVHDYRCLFRVYFMPRDTKDLLVEDPTAFEYLYLQAVNDVLQERFAVEMRCNTALRLAALHIQERLASCGQSPKTNLKTITRTWGMENFVSSTLLRNMREKDLRKAISYHMKKSQTQHEPKQKGLSVNQARINYLEELSDLKSFGGKSFSATMMLQDRESTVTLLVGARYGVSQVVNHKLSIMTSLTEFASITRVELLPESDRVSLVKIYLQDIKPITLLLESAAAKDLACLISGYCRAFVDPNLNIFRWMDDSKKHRVSAEEGYVSRCGSDSDDSDLDVEEPSDSKPRSFDPDGWKKRDRDGLKTKDGENDDDYCPVDEKEKDADTEKDKALALENSEDEDDNAETVVKDSAERRSVTKRQQEGGGETVSKNEAQTAEEQPSEASDSCHTDSRLLTSPSSDSLDALEEDDLISCSSSSVHRCRDTLSQTHAFLHSPLQLFHYSEPHAEPHLLGPPPAHSHPLIQPPAHRTQGGGSVEEESCGRSGDGADHRHPSTVPGPEDSALCFTELSRHVEFLPSPPEASDEECEEEELTTRRQKLLREMEEFIRRAGEGGAESEGGPRGSPTSPSPSSPSSRLDYVFNFNESDAQRYYKLCSNITPDSARSLPRPLPDDGGEEEGQAEVVGDQAKTAEEEAIPILQPPPGFGDSSSDEEFYDARDCFNSPEDLTSGSVPRDSRRRLDVRRSLSVADGDVKTDSDKERGEQAGGGRETLFQLRKRSRKRRSFMETDYTSTVSYPHATQDSNQDQSARRHQRKRLTHVSDDHFLSSDPETSEQTQNPCPTVSSLIHCEGEPAQLASKPIFSSTAAHSLSSAGPESQIRDSLSRSNCKNPDMEMEPDAMEYKSVTELVQVTPPTITVVRCRVDPDGKESTDGSGDGKDAVPGKGQSDEGDRALWNDGPFATHMFLPERGDRVRKEASGGTKGDELSEILSSPDLGVETSEKKTTVSTEFPSLRYTSGDPSILSARGQDLVEIVERGMDGVSHSPPPPPPSTPLPPLPVRQMSPGDCQAAEDRKSAGDSNGTFPSDAEESPEVPPSRHYSSETAQQQLELTAGVSREGGAAGVLNWCRTASDEASDSTNSDNVFDDVGVNDYSNCSTAKDRCVAEVDQSESGNDSLTLDVDECQTSITRNSETQESTWSDSETPVNLDYEGDETGFTANPTAASPTVVTDSVLCNEEAEEENSTSNSSVSNLKLDSSLAAPRLASSNHELSAQPPSQTPFLFQTCSPGIMGRLSASTLRGKIQSLPLYLSRSQECVNQSDAPAQSPAEDLNSNDSDASQMANPEDSTIESVESDDSDKTVTGSEVDDETVPGTVLDEAAQSEVGTQQNVTMSPQDEALPVQTEPRREHRNPFVSTNPNDSTPGPITEPPTSTKDDPNIQRSPLTDTPGPVKESPGLRLKSSSVSVVNISGNEGSERVSASPPPIVVTTQNLNGPGIPFYSQSAMGRRTSSDRPLIGLCSSTDQISDSENTHLSSCAVFTICQDVSQRTTEVQPEPSVALKSSFGCSPTLASGCESVVESLQTPLDACGCSTVYTNCFNRGDGFDDQLTVYEFSCRSHRGSLTQTSGSGLPLLSTAPSPSFLNAPSPSFPYSSVSPSFPRSIIFSSAASELSPLLSPLLESSDCFVSQSYKDTLSRLGRQQYPEPPAGFQELRVDVDQLLSIIEEGGPGSSFTAHGGRHPRDTCPAHFTENNQVLNMKARRLMAGCQKVVGTGQSPEEMFGSLAECFQTLVTLASICLWFSGCDRCDRRNAEAVAGLADVARSFRDFCLAAERASCKRSCQDLSTKLLAKQCTALTASVFCLTQLFRTLTAL